VKKIGVLKNTDIKLDLIQNSDYFSMIDAVDGVIALAWENDEIENRMVFRFGQSEDEITDILYSKDLILKIEKKESYEN